MNNCQAKRVAGMTDDHYMAKCKAYSLVLTEDSIVVVKKDITVNLDTKLSEESRDW